MHTYSSNPFDYLFGKSTNPAHECTDKGWWQGIQTKLTAIADTRRHRDRYDTLMTMSDHMLNDIGLNRAALQRARGAAQIDTRIGPVG